MLRISTDASTSCYCKFRGTHPLVPVYCTCSYLLALSLELLAWVWQAGEADVWVLVGVDRAGQLKQRHVVHQRFAVEVWMNDDVPDANFQMGEARIVNCILQIVVSQTDPNVSGTNVS